MILHFFALSLTLAVSYPCSARSVFLSHDIAYRHQYNSATCWLQCGTASLDAKASHEFNSPVTFSSEYILLQDFRSRALAKFLDHETPWDPGSGMVRALALSLEHGLYPENVWQPKISISQNAEEIFAALDALLDAAKKQGWSQSRFVAAMDEKLKFWTGNPPPESFPFNGQIVSGRSLARQVINGDAIAYDFWPIRYDGSIYGMVSEAAWTHMISRDGRWIAMTDAIGKQTHILPSAATAIKKAEQIFRTGRPLFFTFVYFDGDQSVTFKRKDGALIPGSRPQGTYASSHFLFISGIEYDADNKISGFWARDSVNTKKEDVFLPRDFIEKVGKTFHTIGTACESFLSGSYRFP